MRKKVRYRLISILFALLLFPACALAKDRLAFSGGPEGGTFQLVSSAMAKLLSKNLPDVEVSSMTSVGSVENLRRVDSGEVDFGISYCGDLYLARQGKLPEDGRRYGNVRTLANLYAAPAQLVVLKDSGINSLQDLTGKKIAVGGAGSGAAAGAERFFRAMGLWDKMEIHYIGYDEAAAALHDNHVQAMWVLAGAPNNSVAHAAKRDEIKLLNIAEAGRQTGFFDKYPFYSESIISADTYRGVNKAIGTFQDSALWIAGAHVRSDLVMAALENVFSQQGLASLAENGSTAIELSKTDALREIDAPVHSGALRFWRQEGLPPPEQKRK